MELNLIITALVVGAATALKPTAEQAVKDIYQGIKTLITRRYKVRLESLEKDPASESNKGQVKDDLEKAGAAKDRELLGQAKILLDAVAQYAADDAAAVGVDLEQIRGASLKIEDITSTGAGVRVRDAQLSGDIEIKGVDAGHPKDEGA